MCQHEGFYSCVGRYDKTAARLIYSMVCDECHETLQTVSEQSYEPHPVECRSPRRGRLRRLVRQAA
jgi:hypothetical protein